MIKVALCSCDVTVYGVSQFLSSPSFLHSCQPLIAAVFTLENLRTFLKVSIVIISFDRFKSVRQC